MHNKSQLPSGDSMVTGGKKATPRRSLFEKFAVCLEHRHEYKETRTQPSHLGVHLFMCVLLSRESV